MLRASLSTTSLCRRQRNIFGGRKDKRTVTRAQGIPGEGEQNRNELAIKLKELVQASSITLKKQISKAHTECHTFASELGSVLTPRQAGDTADWILMILSTVVFTFMAMQLYRIYVFMAYPHLLH